MNGSFLGVVLIFSKHCVTSPIQWQTSHDLQKPVTSLNNVGHQYIASKTFLVVLFVTKWFFTILSCSSLRIVYVSSMITHMCNLLFWLCLYITPSFNAYGFFGPIQLFVILNQQVKINRPNIYLIYINSFMSSNQINCI